MHVFVTGATGFVGLHTTLALISSGHTVCLGVRNEHKMRTLYDKHGLQISDYMLGDITDASAVRRALQGCDAVVHAAALVSMDPADADFVYRTNVEGTRNVIGCALDLGIEKLVYVSSAAALFSPGLARIDETSPVASAQSPYAHSKADAENWVREQVAAGAPVTVTYPTGVMGPDDPSLSEGNESLRFILKHYHVHTSSGLQIIDVRDLAQAHVGLLERGHTGGYVVGGHFLTWRELGTTLESVLGRRLLKIPVPGAVLRGVGKAVDLAGPLLTLDMPLSGEAMTFATRWAPCDDAKLRETLAMNYRPIEETLADTARWLAHNGHVPARWLKNLRA